nr:hypothetical protein [Tanacetum cinerariifolium]
IVSAVDGGDDVGGGMLMKVGVMRCRCGGPSDGVEMDEG